MSADTNRTVIHLKKFGTYRYYSTLVNLLAAEQIKLRYCYMYDM